MHSKLRSAYLCVKAVPCCLLYLYAFLIYLRCVCRLAEHMEKFKVKLESMYEASGGKKANIVSHSMGGILVKSFLALHPDVRRSKPRELSFYSMSFLGISWVGMLGGVALLKFFEWCLIKVWCILIHHSVSKITYLSFKFRCSKVFKVKVVNYYNKETEIA